MFVDGVHFYEDAVKSLTKEQFIEQTASLFWQDADETWRIEQLAEVYDKITAKPKRAKASK